jgi:hypothetical protein
LSGNLNETSGLILFDDLLLTINTNGGENKIYGFNLKGKINREIEIEDADNIDWESPTHDKKLIYSGNFGNNNNYKEQVFKIDLKGEK